jgi:hypothetical protein
MSVSEGIKDIFRDITRDKVCEALRNASVNASMSERGLAEEGVGLRPYFNSLGMIDIAEGPIRWINVIRKRVVHRTEHFLNYGVPDPRLSPSSPRVEIISEPRRRFIVFGRISGWTWDGEDSGTGIVGRLNSDSALKETVIRSRVKLTVVAYGKGAFWVVSSNYSEFNIEPSCFPSEEEWRSCQMVAQHLLADWS